jgi:hypothetical protein
MTETKLEGIGKMRLRNLCQSMSLLSSVTILAWL